MLLRWLPSRCASLLTATFLLLLAACSSAPSTPTITPTPSAWNPPITLAQTPQTDAPAILGTSGGLIAAWVGSDDRGVHQDIRRLNANGLSDIVTLPLPPTHPYNQRLFLGVNGNIHLLWLDAGSNDQTALYEAVLTPNLTVSRGPVAVSDGLALSYSAVSDGSGGLWVMWSGGLLSEMSVYLRHIDDEGRPLLDAATIASNADSPALVRTNSGEVWGFWLSNGQLMRQRLNPSGDPQALTSAVSLASGDRLNDVRAALDVSSAYFFWNITRADGTIETWMTSGTLNAGAWRQPERLTIGISDEAAQVQTGFELSRVSTASSNGDIPLRWTEPLTGQYTTAAAVVESDAGLGVLILSGGDVVGFSAAQQNTHLVGAPSLALNVDGSFSLAWSQPGDSTANLQVITTR